MGKKDLPKPEAPKKMDVDADEVTDPAIVKFKVGPPMPPEKPATPANVVAKGAAARDPNAVVGDAPAKLSLRTWILAKKFRYVDMAGFATWARANAPVVCTASEWEANLARYKATPVS